MYTESTETILATTLQEWTLEKKVSQANKSSPKGRKHEVNSSWLKKTMQYSIVDASDFADDFDFDVEGLRFRYIEYNLSLLWKEYEWDYF